jgi:hypothetical protein
MLCTIAAILLLAEAAHGRDIFVNNQLGDDRRTGMSPLPEGHGGGPCRTIGKALRIAGPSDRIVIANTGEPYRESITLEAARHSGDARYPFVILGNGATLDGTISLDNANWEYAGDDMFRVLPAHMSFQQLFLDDHSAPGGQAAPGGQPLKRRQPPEGEAPKLQPLEWCLFQGWIYFGVERDRLPYSYPLRCCDGQVGITLYEVHDVIVEDLNVRGFWLDGVHCADNVRHTTLLRISASENGRSGLTVAGSSRVRIESCTAAGNGAAQLRAEGYSITELVETRLDAASAPAIVKEGGRISESALPLETAPPAPE